MALALTILEQQGFVIPPELKLAMMAQSVLNEQMQAVEQSPEHGGSADKTEPINKHQTERTGGTPGVGRSGVAA
jgi:hypothetical protein